MRTKNTLTALILVVLTAAGCGGMTRTVARNATPAAVDSGLRAVTSDEHQQLVVDAIDEDRVQDATEKLASGTTDGLVDALGEPERQERLTQAVAPMVSSMIDTAINQALTDGNLERVRALAKQATLGFQDAIDEVKSQKESGQLPKNKGNVLEAVNDVAESGDTTLYILGGAAAVLLLLLAFGVVWALRRKRKYEYEARLRDQALNEISRILAEDQGASASDHDEPEQQTKDDGGHPQRLREALRRLAEQEGGPVHTNGHARGTQ